MKTVYPVILTQSKKEVLVEIPDFNLFTEGKDLNDAIVMARDAIGLQGISKQDHGEKIPKASIFRQNGLTEP